MAQPLDASQDKGGLAPHKNRCPHALSGIDIPDDITLKLQVISLENGNNGEVSCSRTDCNESECWLCLKCHKILCGRYGNSHMMEHAQSTNTTHSLSHCMSMGVRDLSFWCYGCQNYINHLSVKRVWDFYSLAHKARFNEEIPNELLKKTTFYKESIVEDIGMETIQESEDETEEDNKQNDDNDDDDANDEKQSFQTTNSTQTNITQPTVDLIDDLLSTFTIEDTTNAFMKTALFYHGDCLLHKPGRNRPHVERPERCSTSFELLDDYGILPHLMDVLPREATKKELAYTHSSKHVDIIVGSDSHGWYDSDTFYNEHSPRAAKLAAGATIDLMSGILQHKYDNGFALVRPPGHHCEHHKPMGFCLFNNAVVAVNCIRKQGLCKKILIVDWDVHHGNGTQNMFYDDSDVLYFSTHRYDEGFFYPGTGHVHESGNGYNINVPLNVSSDGYGDKEYLLIWRDILVPICREFKPEIILISAGFDACIGDPLGGMRITPPCYGLLTRLLLNECSKVAIVLEGGYNLTTMPRAICCVNYALLKGPNKQKDDYDVDEFYAEFKENITDGGGYEDEHDAFHIWYDKYGEELTEVDYSRYVKTLSHCKKSVKMVLGEHQNYWKCAGSILQKYIDDATY